MKTTFDQTTKKLSITELYSSLISLQLQGASLWLTPGQVQPYWAKNAQNLYDRVLAVPNRFLEFIDSEIFTEEIIDIEVTIILYL